MAERETRLEWEHYTSNIWKHPSGLFQLIADDDPDGFYVQLDRSFMALDARDAAAATVEATIKLSAWVRELAAALGEPDAGDGGAEAEALRAEVGRLRKAVEFYADRANRDADGSYGEAYDGGRGWRFDNGDRARAALAPPAAAAPPEGPGDAR